MLGRRGGSLLWCARATGGRGHWGRRGMLLLRLWGLLPWLARVLRRVGVLGRVLA